jgi:hypothetical protein
MVDWDAVDWDAEPDFGEEIDDISADVQDLPSWVRGINKEDGNAPAATLEIKLKPGLISKYSPYVAGSPLHDKIRPWLPCRVRATLDGETFFPVYAGFLSRIHIDPDPDREIVYIYLTDGTDLLARQQVTQDWDDRTPMSDGAAVHAIADAAGWSATRRNIDMSGGDTLLNYPAVYSY